MNTDKLEKTIRFMRRSAVRNQQNADNEVKGTYNEGYLDALEELAKEMELAPSAPLHKEAVEKLNLRESDVLGYAPDKKFPPTQMDQKYPPTAKGEAVEANQPAGDGWDIMRLIGRARERHKELEHKGHEWRAFYTGWMEGRVDMLKSLRILPSDKPVEGVKDEEKGDVPQEILDWIENQDRDYPGSGHAIGWKKGAVAMYHHMQPKDLNVPYWVAQVQNQREKVTALSAALAAEKEANAKLRESYRLSSEEHKRAYSSLWAAWESMGKQAQAYHDLLQDLDKAKTNEAVEKCINRIHPLLNKFTNNKDK